MVHVTSDDECGSYDTMKYSGSDNEIMCGGPVDAILLNSSWGGSSEFYMDSSHKITMDNGHDDSNTKSTMDVLDSLIMNSSNNANFAELKPLPPFTGYTGHLSINGIPGHHYHAIAAPQSPQSPHENNNNPNQVNNNVIYKNHNGVYYSVNSDQSVVSSTVDCGLVKNEPYVDYGGLIVDNIEDIAAIIGSAIADTTVPSVVDTLVSVEDPNGSRDSWMDLDAWIDTACSNNDANQPGKTIISPESLQEFNNTQYSHEEIPSSTLQNLLTQNQFHLQQQNAMKREPVTTNYQMPLLQSRLQNGPPMNGIKENYMKNDYTILKSEYITDCPEPSSTSYLNNKDIMLSHSTSGSPPGVVSTTDSLNGRYQPQRNRYGSGMRGTKSGIGSPDLLNGSSLDGLVGNVNNNNYPHTTTTTTTPSKKNRSRSSRKAQNSGGGGAGSVVYDGSLLGKEKPVHRCTICSRGFLNKSNIKVHLRTHTGEKPFRCEVCGKAFRQKAHLIKHQQIHKGVGRD